MKNTEKSYQKYETLIQTVPDVLYEIDDEGRFVFISDAISSLGYDSKELVGKHFRTIIHTDDCNRVDRSHVLPQFKGKKTGSSQAPKLFDERRTRERMTKNLEARIVFKKGTKNESAFCDMEIHSSGLWGQKPKDKSRVLIGAIGIFRNISHRKKFEQILKKKGEKFLKLIQVDPDGIVVVEPKGKVVFANRSAETLLNRSSKELFRETFTHEFFAGKVSETQVTHGKGKTRIVEIVAKPISWEGKNAVILSLRDETRNIHLRDSLRDQSMADELTRLYNRRGFTMLAEHQLKISERRKEEVCLLYIDVDNMKVINDRHGHSKGDVALLETAAALRKSFRESDITARIGGDEFVVLALASARNSIDIFQSRLSAYFDFVNNKSTLPYTISVSVGGVSLVPKPSIKIEDLVELADRDMYRQKSEKKSSYSDSSD